VELEALKLIVRLQINTDVELDPRLGDHRRIVSILIGLYMRGIKQYSQDWIVEDIVGLRWASDLSKLTADMSSVRAEQESLAARIELLEVHSASMTADVASMEADIREINDKLDVLANRNRHRNDSSL